MPSPDDSDSSCSEFAPNKSNRKGRRIKKNKVRDHKKGKTKSGKSSPVNSTQTLPTTSKDHESAETLPTESSKEKSMVQQEKTLNPFLHRLLSKPAYMQLTVGNQLTGPLGHSTAILRRPIVEGIYFLEVVIK